MAMTASSATPPPEPAEIRLISGAHRRNVAAPRLTLLGFGAIGQAVFERSPAGAITEVLVRRDRCAQVQQALGARARAVHELSPDCTVLVECAGHTSVREHILPALAQGIECAIVSTGALAEAALASELEIAAIRGNTRLHVLAGAIGAIDTLSAARHAGLEKVIYRGRKPPRAWYGSPAEDRCDLSQLATAMEIFRGSAREAAALYPKNANVAATVALASLGMDQTQVSLIADPKAGGNVHEVEASGTFGELALRMRGQPLPDNPKTSMLAMLSVLRFVHAQRAGLCV